MSDNDVLTEHAGAAPAMTARPKNRKIIAIAVEARAGQAGEPAMAATQSRTLRLDKDRIVVGSVVSADVQLKGPGVAPLHAVIEVTQDSKQPATAQIYDLASDSGVMVNGARGVMHPLKPGDKIAIGPYQLTFNLEDLEKIAFRDIIRESGDRKLFLNPDEDFSPLLLEDERQVIEIFDYRPSNRQALEVVMSWNDTILDVEHFVKERAVTVGQSRKDDFGIPPLISTKAFPIVKRVGEGFVLNVDSKMKGIMQRKGELRSFEELKGAGADIPINADDFAKVSIGDIDFYISFTSAPPRLKPTKMEKDALLFQVMGVSLLLTTATIMGLWSIRVPQALEAEQVPDRIATILYQPEKYQFHNVVPKAPPANTQAKAEPPKPKAEPPKPKAQPTTKITLQNHPIPNKPIPKEMNVAQNGSKTSTATHTTKAGSNHAQSQAKEGEGARAKGPEGSRGAKNGASHNEHQTAAFRPSPNGGPGRGGGQSQVRDNGNVDILKDSTAKIQDLLGNAAAQLGKGGEKLKGFGGFTTVGNGGLALSGEGKGGGGDAETTLGGLGNKGRGGGRVGTGLGAAGNGDGIIGGKARMVIRGGGSEEGVVMGAIDEDAILAAILAHKDEFRLCYEREINAENPGLAGQVIPSWVIGSSGRVTQAGIESTTLHNANTERCILQVLKRIDFPVPRGGGIVEVRFPFKFSPVNH